MGRPVSAREGIRIPFGLAVAMAGQEVGLVDGVLDEYEAAHRAEVLTEAADGIVAHCFTHNPDATTGWITCHCEVADDLRKQAVLLGLLTA